MPEVFEAGDLQLIAGPAAVEVIDNVRAFVEVDEMQAIGIAHRVDQSDKIASVLFGTFDVSLFINQPGNGQVRSVLIAKLLGAKTGGVHKISPPVVMGGVTFVLFPLAHGHAADEENPFTLRWAFGGAGLRRKNKQDDREKNPEELAHI
jgi:hypothetical protein